MKKQTRREKASWKFNPYHHKYGERDRNSFLAGARWQLREDVAAVKKLGTGWTTVVRAIQVIKERAKS